MMDENPELAYEHARAAYRRAPRIDVVREALGISAYLTGRYSEALRELRTYRRMTDDYSHVAIEADSERGLGRAEKALRFIDEIPLRKLDAASTLELALVKSGARADCGDSQGGLEVLERINVDNLDEELRARIELIRSDRYDELGREEEAKALREKWEPVFRGDGEVDYFEEEIPQSDIEEIAATATDGTDESDGAGPAVGVASARTEDEWTDLDDISDEDWPERAELETGSPESAESAPLARGGEEMPEPDDKDDAPADDEGEEGGFLETAELDAEAPEGQTASEDPESAPGEATPIDDDNGDDGRAEEREDV